jgi:hypothetical protein
MGQTVEGLQLLHPVVHLTVGEVPLGAALGNIHDPGHEVRARSQPPVVAQHFQDIPAQGHHLVRVQQPSEEEVALLRQPAAQLLRVVPRVVGNPELQHLCGHYNIPFHLHSTARTIFPVLRLASM